MVSLTQEIEDIDDGLHEKRVIKQDTEGLTRTTTR